MTIYKIYTKRNTLPDENISYIDLNINRILESYHNLS